MDIDVVIPNYNGKKFLQACIDSLQEQDWRSFNIIVVDNGSTDGSALFLQEHYPEVETLLWDTNRGFSAAVNAGIKRAAAPLIFLLNNDTELDRSCLGELARAAEEHPECDIFATKMYNYSQRTLLDGAGDAYLRGGAGYRLGTMERDSSEYDESKYVFGACAGAALYRRSLFEEIGFFDEDFFAYLEDVDLNLRAAWRGKQCWYVATAKIFHIGSATTGSKINEFTVRLTTKNSFNILLKNYPVSLFLRVALPILIYQFFWFCFLLKKRKITAYIQGIRLFWQERKRMSDKRKWCVGSITSSNAGIAEMLKASEKDAVLSIMKRRRESGKGNILLRIYLRLFCS